MVVLSKILSFNIEHLENIVIENINPNDFPDFCDAYIVSAEIDGRELTDEELETISINESAWIQEYIHENQLYI